MDLDELRAKIRDIKDFPTEGILFKDITTLLRDRDGFRRSLDLNPNDPTVARIIASMFFMSTAPRPQT